MDEHELKTAVKVGPIVIHMNDGRSIDVPSPDIILVGTDSASVLIRDDTDGKMRHTFLRLKSITGIESALE